MNIIIAGYALRGFGGMEMVCKRLVHIMSTYNPSIHIKFVFFKEEKNVDHSWHSGLNVHIMHSSIHNTKARRLHFSLLLTRYLLENKPDLIITLDTISCFITYYAKKLVFGSYPIVSWLHFSVYDLYKYTYVLRCDAHLVISDGIKRQLNELGVDKKHIHTIFNPVEKTNKMISVSVGVSNFVFIGRVIFKGQKNLKELFDSLLDLHGEWFLHIVGQGDDLDTCKKYTNNIGLSNRIKWHGWKIKPWDFIENNIGHIKALVMTSTYEGLPMTILEAMSYGIFCVSSDCPTGPSDIINDTNGRLYKTGDVQQLTSILQDLIDDKIGINQLDIQKSINKFYDENYYYNLTNALNCIIR